jgi:hypothetical protein
MHKKSKQYEEIIMARVQAYGATVSVGVAGLSSNCGANLISSFNGGQKSLSDKKRADIYDLLMIDVIKEGRDFGLLVASGVTTKSKKDDGWTPAKTGYPTLEEFCDHHGFTSSEAAHNNNSSNDIRSWTLALSQVEEDGKIKQFQVSPPDMGDYDPAAEKKAEQEEALKLLAAMAAEARK